MLRLITFVFASLSMLVPSCNVYLDGHTHVRFGKATWQENMFVDTWYGIVLWVVYFAWLIKPLIENFIYLYNQQK